MRSERASDRERRSIRWVWWVLPVVFVLMLPAASFLNNRKPVPAAPPPAPSTSTDLDFGAPVSFESRLGLSFGPGTNGVAIRPRGGFVSGTMSEPVLALGVVRTDGEGRTWVVDQPTASASRVRVFDMRSRLVSSFETTYGATLFTPGVRDDLWVVLSASTERRETLLRYDMRGRVLGEYRIPPGVATRFVRLDPDGNVYAYQEQWSMDAEKDRSMFSGSLLQIAIAGATDYGPTTDPKSFPGVFFGADDRLYVAASSEKTGRGRRLSVKAVDRSGAVAARYELPDGAVPVGADAEGRVYAEGRPPAGNDEPGHATLGDVHQEDATVWVVERNGSTSHFYVKRPLWMGGWPMSIWVDPVGRPGALRMDERGLTVGTLRLGSSAPLPQAAGPWRPHLRVISDSEPRTGDPYAARDAAERDLMQMVYAGLVSFDARLRPRPSLATAVPSKTDGSVSDDGKTIVYTLRRGVTWHDGTPVTGADVAATWHYLRQPRLESRTEPFPGFRHIVDVQARGDVVAVKLDQPFGAGPETFFPYVLPAHLLGERGAYSTSHLWARPVGSGPYRMQRWLAGESWRLVAHDRPAGRRPAIERLEVRFSSEASASLSAFMSAPLPTAWTWVDFESANVLRRDRMGEVSTAETGRWRGVVFDTSDPLLRKAEIREALVSAYPRRSLARDVLPASTATDAVDMFPRVSASHRTVEEPSRSDDVAEGERLLREVGLSVDKSRAPTSPVSRLDVTLGSGMRRRAYEASYEYFERVARAWDKAGAVSHWSSSVPRMYESWFDGGFLAVDRFSAAYGIFPGTLDPGWGGIFDRSEAPSPTLPRGIGVVDGGDDVARLYSEAKASYDRTERATIGRRISALVRERSLAIHERYETRDVAVRDVEGVTPAPYPAGDFWNVAEWRLTKR